MVGVFSPLVLVWLIGGGVCWPVVLGWPRVCSLGRWLAFVRLGSVPTPSSNFVMDMLPEMLSLDLSGSGGCTGLRSSFSACGPACFFGRFPTCLPEKHGELKKFVCHLGCPTPV